MTLDVNHLLSALILILQNIEKDLNEKVYEDKEVPADENLEALNITHTLSDGDKSVITTHDIGIKPKKQNRIRSKSHENKRLVLADDIDNHSVQETKSEKPQTVKLDATNLDT